MRPPETGNGSLVSTPSSATSPGSTSSPSASTANGADAARTLISAADFLGSGSFKALIYGFFRPVFNSLEDGSDLTFVASLTNSIAVSILVLSLCFRAGYRKRGVDAAGTMVMILTLLLGLLLNAGRLVKSALD